MKEFKINQIGEVNLCEEGALIVLDKKYVDGLKGLEGFGHLNVVWWCDEFDFQEARDTLVAEQPYRNAPKELGVFATRSPVRPNLLAITTVQITEIDYQNGVIKVPYIDANDKTPVLDLKPYTPSIDRIEEPQVPKWCKHWPNSVESSGEFDWEKEFNF